jgi:hypothetical protein
VRSEDALSVLRCEPPRSGRKWKGSAQSAWPDDRAWTGPSTANGGQIWGSDRWGLFQFQIVGNLQPYRKKPITLRRGKASRRHLIGHASESILADAPVPHVVEPRDPRVCTRDWESAAPRLTRSTGCIPSWLVPLVARQHPREQRCTLVGGFPAPEASIISKISVARWFND